MIRACHDRVWDGRLCVTLRWDQDDVIGELLENYDRLDEDLRTDLPLKRIWTVALQEVEE